jgi:hypothetical protein
MDVFLVGHMKKRILRAARFLEELGLLCRVYSPVGHPSSSSSVYPMLRPTYSSYCEAPVPLLGLPPI